ncbi:hypothetical protein [Amycolatopsis sp. lyj-109]|uniref:hypothetical protein n=1 Tax=Amycolatopsis sp. lyj-109 TaxID=2789287 RepID=UPI00397AE2D1
MISVSLEYLADMLTLERCSKFVRLEKAVRQLDRWCAELVTLLPMAPAAQASGVVGCERCPAPRAATTTR